MNGTKHTLTVSLTPSLFVAEPGWLQSVRAFFSIRGLSGEDQEQG